MCGVDALCWGVGTGHRAAVQFVAAAPLGAGHHGDHGQVNSCQVLVANSFAQTPSASLRVCLDLSEFVVKLVLHHLGLNLSQVEVEMGGKDPTAVELLRHTLLPDVCTPVCTPSARRLHYNVHVVHTRKPWTPKRRMKHVEAARTLPKRS